jgi:hypothetical protein
MFEALNMAFVYTMLTLVLERKSCISVSFLQPTVEGAVA